MRDAISKGQQRAKELKKNQERTMGKGGRGISSATAISSSNSHNFASADAALNSSSTSSYVPKTPAVSAAASSKGGGKALKLGANKTVSEDAFLQQLRSEGQLVADLQKSSIADKGKPVIHEDRSPVYVQAIEKLNASVSRNGGIESAEILGNVSLNLTESEFNTVTLKMKCKQVVGTQIQIHPNLDKQVWQKESRLQLKSIQKPYPLNTDVGLVKWRNVLNEEEQLPLTLNVFPSESADGCTVNIEYTLQKEIQLSEVVITIPLPPATQPIVSEVYGSYDYVRSKSQLLWTIPIIDSSSESGTLEFSVPNGHSDHFFPVNITFTSENLICGIEVEDVINHDGSDSVEHTLHSGIVVDKYEII
uniref:Coatomer subunit delta n=1 Tax=Panagrolaimus superbus TaxID=310955 RepID=A0A914XTW7_9BILA